MKAGFVTETHTLIYCHGCGEPWHAGDPEMEGIPVCFGGLDDSEIVRRIESTGWRVDGDLVHCDGCTAVTACEETGCHHWASDEMCTRCGMFAWEVNR
ncbi:MULTISPECIES: hypothetical protein [unclassified Nocardia]|uniref:hypothetical protein n=1 Tax=unclassified Nocardia TaxID=2637762 RepID=UPI001CE3E183|nr:MULTISPECIES: hypothetical protein [unclassified Nocardia]